MKTGKTDQLIINAIAALPYRRPSAGFSARIMAAVAVQPARQPWPAFALKAFVLIVTAWSAAIAFAAGKLVYANLADIAAFFIQPGGLRQALELLAGRAALALVKVSAVLSLASEVLAAGAAGLPAWYEITAAVLLCSAAIAALSHGARLARQQL